jgi:putative heme-binding domain-containing protein
MSRLRQLAPARHGLALVTLAAFLPLALYLLAPRAAVHSADDAGTTPRLTFEKADHICIIGNTLPDRMQHDGWLETYLHARFPLLHLTIRNLGFSGDEVAGCTSKPNSNFRLRSQSFGTADQWLAGSAPVPEPNRLVTRHGVRENRFETTGTKADVIFAFFGYNESFAGEAGLPKFRQDLDDFVKHALAQKYNGKSAPRLVLLSPIAFEDHKSPNLPDGKETNKRLEMYTKTMAEVAGANKVPFVDLFAITQRLHKQKPLTINGVHLTEYGNQLVAGQICQALFGDPAGGHDPAFLEKLRQAVLDKNFYWFNRYRVMDGYNVYGGRAFEKYADQQSNYEDQQRELEILDVKTANRDKRIWAIAASGGRESPEIDDSNCPPLIPVKTNKPGSGPGGTHIFLDGEQAIQKMTVAKGMKVTLFTSEKEWPELAKPVQMQFDPQGRLWVAVWPSYPHWKPTEEMNDKILIFEDTRGTGKADKMTVFADHLNCPTGFEFYNGGVLVAQAPDLLFLKDTKGTGKADLRTRVLSGLDSADSHHTANSFALDPGGALYWQEGTFHRTQVETPYGPPVRCADAGVYRYEPRTQKFEVYVTYPFANPHGHVWDHWGQDIVYDGTGANPYHGALFSGHLEFPQKHAHPPQVYQQRTRPCPGVEVLSSRHFPAENQGNLLVANVIGFQGILQYRVEDKGASFVGTEVEPIVSSTDPNFRPSDLKIGPDGAIWFIDWHNPIIGHLQHAIRDPNRDRTHGRIYRVTYEGRELLKPANIAGEPIDKLLEVLKEPDDRVRYRARIELGGRKTEDVMAALTKWIAALDPADANYEHNMLEALWAHQAHNVVDEGLLRRMLASKDFHARAAATRVLCYWRDRVPDALDLLRKMAADEHPRVRLEAVRAASFFTEPEAIEVVLIAESKPRDPYIDFVRAETKKALDPIVSRALKEGRRLSFQTTAGARYFLRNVGTDDLLRMKPRTEGIYLELLFRPGVRDEYRRESLTGLAAMNKQSEVRVLLDAVKSRDGASAGRESSEGQDESVAFDLLRLLTAHRAEELAADRAEFESLALKAQNALTRELGFAALIAADGGVDHAWTLGTQSTQSLQDLVRAMPMVRDPGQRAALYPRVESLLAGLPPELQTPENTGKAVKGRYVRIELPGRRKTLTLAEVEVYSGGRNIARTGKATQKNTGFGGDASRAIDGNTSGNYGDGGQSHTEENTANPWWEVDLGSEQPIASIVIYNRTDGGLGKRLDGYTLRVFDAAHRTPVFERKNQRAPDVKTVFLVGQEPPERTIRRAAMLALTSVRGQEEATFRSLAKLLKDESDRPAAIAALLHIPTRDWPKDEARPSLDAILSYVRKVPTAERTSPAVLDAMQLGDSLASLLPLAEAKAARKELGELGVRVIRLSTLTDQMLFDKDRIVLRAGKPAEVFFENTDIMPHNFVITTPGAMEEIGALAEAQATQPGAAERGYVPESKHILVKSRLLQPRESQKIDFAAPSKPGIYPYVCTYPGHWRRMYGALYVVEDLDEYLAAPEAYLAAHPLPVADELLKFNRPRTEWKFEELAKSVEGLSGRSFSNGKQLFTVTNCVACHKLGGAGIEVGPDLTKLDPKQQSPLEILHDILEPSFRINEKYQSYSFEMKSGKAITGLIVKETPEAVEVLVNPLAKEKPVVLKLADIDERKKSPTSIMPKGLLDKLTHEEILDLVAYVYAGGDPNHKVFQGGHHH